MILTYSYITYYRWLDSSLSLYEQDINEGDLVILRFKYSCFYDLNSKVYFSRMFQTFIMFSLNFRFNFILYTQFALYLYKLFVKMIIDFDKYCN